MNYLKFGITLLIFSVSLVGNVAWADRGAPHHHHGHSHVGVGVYFGAPLFSPWYYPAAPYYGPAYYSAPAIITQPPVYIEQSSSAPSNVWYYCRNPDGYYPYVKQCPSGWVTVMP
jgi:hypothetical protein